jgi:hypothetical protein
MKFLVNNETTEELVTLKLVNHGTYVGIVATSGVHSQTIVNITPDGVQPIRCYGPVAKVFGLNEDGGKLKVVS